MLPEQQGGKGPARRRRPQTLSRHSGDGDQTAGDGCPDAGVRGCGGHRDRVPVSLAVSLPAVHNGGQRLRCRAKCTRPGRSVARTPGIGCPQATHKLGIGCPHVNVPMALIGGDGGGVDGIASTDHHLRRHLLHRPALPVQRRGVRSDRSLENSLCWRGLRLVGGGLRGVRVGRGDIRVRVTER